jgi:hypothetical protein
MDLGTGLLNTVFSPPTQLSRQRALKGLYEAREAVEQSETAVVTHGGSIDGCWKAARSTLSVHKMDGGSASFL